MGYDGDPTCPLLAGASNMLELQGFVAIADEFP